jgi:4'-phosphopantetheinyl transferase
LYRQLLAFVLPVSAWRAAPDALKLGRDEVHVWRATLDQVPSQTGIFLRTLAADERTRAERFYFQSDRERFVVARGILRAILGGYLNRAPESLSFCYGSRGKPALSPGSSQEAIGFNLSHSGNTVLYAVTRGREVGVDLELIRPQLSAERLAERFFSPREVDALRSLPADLRRHAFFLAWTRKEAYIKARGEGLSLPLNQFDVSLIPGEPAALLSAERDPQEILRWRLQELMPGPGYVAALAVEGHGWSLCCWDWPTPL